MTKLSDNTDGSALQKRFFFAGGGTGGHLYPALAVAGQLRRLCPDCSVTFFCSSRLIDARVLTGSGFDFMPLPAEGFSMRPRRFVRFAAGFFKSCEFVKQILRAERYNAVVLSTGGFVSAPAVVAARALSIPVAILNVDILPGKANKIMARFAKKIFVQFEASASAFGRHSSRVIATGCPLRSGFCNPDPQKAIAELGLDPGKKILLVTGASSGSRDINSMIIKILPRLKNFAQDWQIVHLTGQANFQQVSAAAAESPVSYLPVEYYDNMPDLYAAAALVVGRSGAVSVAEYAAAAIPAVCIPYPYHKDRHQRLNALQLADKGAAVIIEQNLKNFDASAGLLLDVLMELMSDADRRKAISAAAKSCAKPDAAQLLARELLRL